MAGKFHAVGDILQRGVVTKLVPFPASTVFAKPLSREVIPC